MVEVNNLIRYAVSKIEPITVDTLVFTPKFYDGSLLDIQKQIEGVKSVNQKSFPAVWLLRNFKSSVENYTETTNCNIYLLGLTQKQWLTPTRVDNVITPLLRPLERALVAEIQKTGAHIKLSYERTDIINAGGGVDKREGLVISEAVEAVELSLSITINKNINLKC